MARMAEKRDKKNKLAKMAWYRDRHQDILERTPKAYTEEKDYHIEKRDELEKKLGIFEEMSEKRRLEFEEKQRIALEEKRLKDEAIMNEEKRILEEHRERENAKAELARKVKEIEEDREEFRKHLKIIKKKKNKAKQMVILNTKLMTFCFKGIEYKWIKLQKRPKLRSKKDIVLVKKDIIP